MEGIKTLERKDRQRESKTALLLALKDDMIDLKKRQAEDHETIGQWSLFRRLRSSSNFFFPFFFFLLVQGSLQLGYRTL